MKHTLGNWQAQVGWNKAQQCYGSVTCGKKLLASTPDNFDKVPAEEHEGNVALMAAAPTLAKTLQSMDNLLCDIAAELREHGIELDAMGHAVTLHNDAVIAINRAGLAGT